MKAISIKQPWASLIIEGIKPVENRAMLWKHRGPLAIHASKTFDCWPTWLLTFDGVSDIIEESRDLTGGIIGSVNMVDCVMLHDSPFFFGPMGYVFEDPKECDLIPWKGKQGVMNIDLSNDRLAKLSQHYPGYYDCYGCGNMLDKFPKNLECPICGKIILPF